MGEGGLPVEGVLPGLCELFDLDRSGWVVAQGLVGGVCDGEGC